MRVHLIATTQAAPAVMEDVAEFVGDDIYNDASLLSEFAGRACYRSFNRPNPDTASNDRYLANIIEQKHFSVLEHGSATFYVQEVSRSLTHELVRHRHMSFSQLSQRYAKVDDGPVYPPLFEDDNHSLAVLLDAWKRAIRDYDHLVNLWLPRLIQAGVPHHAARKQAREAARSVLPNMTPTAITVTANHRTWREFIEKRATVHADAEICRFAVKVYDILSEVEPNLYQDFRRTAVVGRAVVEKS